LPTLQNADPPNGKIEATQTSRGQPGIFETLDVPAPESAHPLSSKACTNSIMFPVILRIIVNDGNGENNKQ
jgi:hypothetical protein